MFGSSANREILREAAKLEANQPRSPRPLLQCRLPSPEDFNMKWTSRLEDPTSVVLTNLAQARSSVLIANQELEPEFFEDPTFDRFLGDKLKSGVTWEIIFRRSGIYSPEEAVASFQRKNPKLVEHQQAFLDSLAIYWVPKDVVIQFMIVDERLTMIAEPVQTPGEVAAERERRAQARGLKRIGNVLADLFKKGYELDPLTDYSTVPHTQTYYDDRKLAKVLNDRVNAVMSVSTKMTFPLPAASLTTWL